MLRIAGWTLISLPKQIPSGALNNASRTRRNARKGATDLKRRYCLKLTEETLLFPADACALRRRPLGRMLAIDPL
jgi:hypothetical protein